jgi:hypothetical protein
MSNDLYRKMNLQFFAEPTDPQDPPADPPKDPQDPPKEPVKTFTQDDLDKIVADRIARERKKYGDYDDLKTKLSEFEKQAEERRLAELSEKERLEEIAKKHESEKLTLAQQLDEMRSAIQREKVVNEFIKIATSNNIQYIDDALKLADLSAVVIEDGKVVGVEDVVKSLVDNKPFLVGTKTEPKQIGNASNPNPNANTKTKEQMLQEAADKARKSGRIEDMQKYAALKMELGL